MNSSTFAVKGMAKCERRYRQCIASVLLCECTDHQCIDPQPEYKELKEDRLTTVQQNAGNMKKEEMQWDTLVRERKTYAAIRYAN